MSKFIATLYQKLVGKTATPNMAKQASSAMEGDVIFESFGNKGVVTLNRPKALNALNLSMINKLYPTLKAWEKSKSLVIIKGTGGKAFCAGGDVRAIAESGLGPKSQQLGSEFFKNEYKVNALIGNYKVPYVAVIDGIVMGGGVGLSVHGPYRIATEKSVFAMPETQIGLFPDVGGSHFLPRLQGKLGLYLALTGYRLKGSEVLKAGVATHLCDSNKLSELEADLLKSDDISRANIEATLAKHRLDDKKEFSLEPYLGKINECFSGSSVEEILRNLERDGSEWAVDTLKTLSKMSPTSLKVTKKQLEFGSQLNLKDCLQMEYRIALRCLENKDYYEGVRALLIDKDQKPVWNPPKLEEVSAASVEQYFNRLPEDQELKYD